MKKDQIKRLFVCLMPLLCAIVAFAFMFGDVLVYTIKYVPEGATEAIKESFALNLVSLFDASVGLPWATILIIVFIALGGILPVLGLFNLGKIKDSLIYSSVVSFAIAACFTLILKEIYIGTVAYSIDNFKSADLGWASSCVVLFSIVGAIFALTGIEEKIGLSTKSIAEDALLIATSFVLNFIKVPLQQTGGSVNLQLLPLFIIALRRGPAHAFVCSGLIYGLLTCLTDGYGFATYPFDYVIGFGSAGVIGIFNKILLNKEKPIWERYIFIVIAVIVSTCVRFIGGMTSSMVIYGKGFQDAAIYNSPYVFLSGLAALVGLCILYPTVLKLNTVFPVKESR